VKRKTANVKDFAFLVASVPLCLSFPKLLNNLIQKN
jgi:hypothetical protein